jgi:hypothetical protein
MASENEDSLVVWPKPMSDIAGTQVVDLTSICSTFPEKPDCEIQRENMISTLLGQLKKNTEIIVVEGEEGVGKTTLLAQFARAHGSQTFSAFVTDSSRYAWDPVMLAQNLLEQIRFALGNVPVRKQTESDIHSLLHESVGELQKKANWEKKAYYFLIDGLDEVPAQEGEAVEQIINLLPLGLATFRFLLSGSTEKLAPFRRGRVTLKPWTLPPLSLDETVKYFNGIKVNREHFETIYRLSNKGVPGKLASIRRICSSASDADRVLTNLSDHAPDLLEQEWNSSSKAPEEMRLALAALCFDTRRHNLNTLAALCGIELNKLKGFLEKCTFIQWGSSGEKQLSFASYFKKFAAKKLLAFRKTVLRRGIEQLMAQPESSDALTHLPAYLNESEEYGRLVDYLSEEHFGKLIECSESWIPLNQKADLGVVTARRLNRDVDLLRFGLLRSALTDLESCEQRRSEIEAYIALGDASAAYAVAQSAIAKEDRLQMLAIIASAKRKRGLAVEPELKEQVRQLYDQLDRKGLGRRAAEIALDLAHWQPELAIDLIRTSQQDAGSQQNVDVAFANLSVRTLLERTREPDPAEARAQMRAQLQDPAIQKFVDTVSLLWGGYSASEVISLIDKWEKPADRIYVMRIWTNTNRDRSDAAEVVNHALDTVIATTDFAPNARVYRELAMPLPQVVPTETARLLVARFDGVKALIESTGPTEEYVRLQLLLAATENSYAQEAAVNRFTDIYYSISYLKDLATKTACMARLTATLQRTDPTRAYDARCDLHNTTSHDLEECLRELLTVTADHYQAVEPAIEALTRSAPERALDLAISLNTEPRRDSARVKIIEVLVQRDVQNVQSSFVEKLLTQIHYPSNYDRALSQLLKGLVGRKNESGCLLPMLIPLVEKSRKMTSPETRCEVLLHIHEICSSHPDKVPPTFLGFIREELRTAWTQIDLGYSRVDTGFRLIAAMATQAPDFARSLQNAVNDNRAHMALDCQNATHTYIMCCRLAFRAFSGLISRKVFGPSDLDDLAELIDNIPSARIRAMAWSEIALRLYIDGDETACRERVLRNVKGAINQIPTGASDQRTGAIVGTAAALFCSHPGTAEEMIETLGPADKDEAYGEICEFLLTKELPFDPHDGNVGGRKHLATEIIWEICRILAKIQADHTVYRFLEKLADNLEVKRNRNSYTREEFADVLRRLKGLVTKFPSPNFIQHEGYRVLAEGQLARLEKSGPSVWDALIARARAVPNHSDQAFILSQLAGALPTKLSTKKRELFEEAKKKMASLSSLHDRLDRYETLAKAALEFDRSLSRSALQTAIQDSMETETQDLTAIRKRLVDMAYRMDADFAANLASGLDDDPVRMAKQHEIKERLETLKLRDSLQKGDEKVVSKTGQNPEKLAEAAWMALRNLNSGKVNAIQTSHTRSYVQQASGLHLTQAYWMLSLVIENAVRHYKHTDEASRYLKPLFRVCVVTADLAFRMAAKMRNSAIAHRLSMSAKDGRDRSLILGGERQKALERIRHWVRDQAKEFIKICDPYFGPEDLDLIQLIRAEHGEIPIAVLTSRKHQKDVELQSPWEEAYQAHWRLHISEADPGEVRIVIVGSKESGAMPIHDRWLLSAGSGLRLGSSLNSLGVSKASELTEISHKDLSGIQTLMDRHLNGVVKDRDGERLLSSSFYLA